MRPATVLRLAVAGSRVDVVRLVLTAFGAALATLALLSAITVAVISPSDGPYTSDLLNQSGLHPGVVIALVGLCVPVLVLLAQCSRIGAPARDRRLAAMRLGGATPGEVGRIVAVESGVGALVGSLLGAAVYFVLRAVLDGRVLGAGSSPAGVVGTSGYAPLEQYRGALRLPTDVLPPWWTLVVVVLAVPLLVVLATTFALRRVAFTPFGVSRRVRTKPPRVLPLVLVVVGVGGFFGVAALLDAVSVPGGLIITMLLAGFVLALLGLLSGQAAMTQALGRLIVSRTSRPALLLAARRMIADPFASTRATAVLTVAVIVAAGARHLRNVTVAGQGDSSDGFYTNAYDLVDLVLLVAAVLAALGLLVAAAEGIVARRRTYAAVVAGGTPRGVVARAVVAETMLPLVASLLLATIIGTVAAIGFIGRTTDVYDDALNTSRTVVVGVAWGPLSLTLLIALGVTLVATALGLVFLRSATDVSELRAAA